MKNAVFAGGPEQLDQARTQQGHWLQEAVESTDTGIQMAARYLLGVLYLQQRRFTDAETMLASVHAPAFDTRHVMPTLRMLQDRYDEAEKLTQQNLLFSLGNVVTGLLTLTSVYDKQKQPDRVRCAAEAAETLSEAFGLAGYFGIQLGQIQAFAARQTEDPEAMVQAVLRMARTMLDFPRYTRRPLL